MTGTAIAESDQIRCVRCHGATRKGVADKVGPNGYAFCTTCAPIAREEYAKHGVVTRCPEGRRNLEDVADAARTLLACFDPKIGTLPNIGATMLKKLRLHVERLDGEQ